MISIEGWLAVPIEFEFEVSIQQLDVMVAHGVDARDVDAVAYWYRDHLGATIDGVYFMTAQEIRDRYEVGSDAPDVEEWHAAGEAPAEYWPDDEDEDDD